MAEKIQTAPQTGPRKTASQARSRATVDALVEATARILVRDGYEAASTNRIAHEAGVGIGSLYQYFPNKEALVAAVIDRHRAATMEVVRAALLKVGARPVEEAIGALVRVGVEAHRVDPRLHKVLTEQAPRTGRMAAIEAIGRETLDMVHAYLEAHRGELDTPDTRLAAFVCATTIEALTHAAVVDAAEPISDAEAERLVEEATVLIVRYLKAAARVRAPPEASGRRDAAATAKRRAGQAEARDHERPTRRFRHAGR